MDVIDCLLGVGLGSLDFSLVDDKVDEYDFSNFSKVDDKLDNDLLTDLSLPVLLLFGTFKLLE